MTLRDEMEREVGGGFRMGNTCIYTVLAWNGVGSLSLLQGIFPT